MDFLLGYTSALVPRASVQPVNLHHLCLRAVLLVVPVYRSSSMSDQPLFSWSVLEPLWTTAPRLEFDFVGSSGVLSPVEPTLFKP